MAAMKLLPENTELEILDLSDIPFFNEDVEEEGIPIRSFDSRKSFRKRMPS
jgi:NAD(P)H-dependent FMN reductase